MTSSGAELEAVRASLQKRIAAIGGCRPSRRELAMEIGAIRAIATGAGLRPAVAVAYLLDNALARGEQGPLVHGWLAVLSDAVETNRSDAAACDTFAAACAVRFIG